MRREEGERRREEGERRREEGEERREEEGRGGRRSEEREVRRWEEGKGGVIHKDGRGRVHLRHIHLHTFLHVTSTACICKLQIMFD